MVRLAISVEGSTEERFINMVMNPYLQERNIFTTPVQLGRRGGNVCLQRIKNDLNKLANNFDIVTTLYDFYGFKNKDPDENKDSLEQKIVEVVSPRLQSKVIPYIQMHEFEGLLFASPEAMENNIHKTGLANWAQTILNQFSNDPEKINDSPQTAPSKRLTQESPYKKTVDGPNICKEIGLDGLRQKCRGFNDWVSNLEALEA